MLQSLNEAPKQSKLEVYRDPEYKIDSVYSPRLSYSRASYTGSRSSLVSTDDSPQLESRKGSFTELGSMSNRGSKRSSRSQLPLITKRSSEVYEHTNSLHRYSAQETSSPSIKKRPSSLSNFTSASTLAAKRSNSSVVSPLAPITPKGSAESSPITARHSSSPVGYPVNILPSADSSPHTTRTSIPPVASTLPSADEDIQEPSSSKDAAKAVSVVAASEHHDVPMQMLSEDQVEKITDTSTANETVAETTFTEEKKKSAPIILFGSRNETGPFEIEVTKGFWGLGVTVDSDKAGAIFVKALTSRSPFSKDGNIKLVLATIEICNSPNSYSCTYICISQGGRPFNIYQ